MVARQAPPASLISFGEDASSIFHGFRGVNSLGKWFPAALMFVDNWRVDLAAIEAFTGSWNTNFSRLTPLKFLSLIRHLQNGAVTQLKGRPLFWVMQSHSRDYVIHPIYCVYPWIRTLCTISVLCKFTICSFWMVFAMKNTISKLIHARLHFKPLTVSLSMSEIPPILHSRDDQAYELQLDYGKTRVYCRMSSIPGCGSGGYTLVMKINGSAVRSQIYRLRTTPVGFFYFVFSPHYYSFIRTLIHQSNYTTISPPVHPFSRPNDCPNV